MLRDPMECRLSRDSLKRSTTAEFERGFFVSRNRSFLTVPKIKGFMNGMDFATAGPRCTDNALSCLHRSVRWPETGPDRFRLTVQL